MRTIVNLHLVQPHSLFFYQTYAIIFPLGVTGFMSYDMIRNDYVVTRDRVVPAQSSFYGQMEANFPGLVRSKPGFAISFALIATGMIGVQAISTTFALLNYFARTKNDPLPLKIGNSTLGVMLLFPVVILLWGYLGLAALYPLGLSDRHYWEEEWSAPKTLFLRLDAINRINIKGAWTNFGLFVFVLTATQLTVWPLAAFLRNYVAESAWAPPGLKRIL